MKLQEGGRKGRRDHNRERESSSRRGIWKEEDINSGGNKPAATGRNWWDRGVACRRLGLFKSAPCASYKLQGSILWFRHIVYKWTALLYMTPLNSTWPERLSSRGSTSVLSWAGPDSLWHCLPIDYRLWHHDETPRRSMFRSKWIALFTW